MCMIDEINAKRGETCAVAGRSKAGKLCAFGSCALKGERHDTAYLSSDGTYSLFSYGDNTIRFMTSPRLVRYSKVVNWDNGYIEVLARYGERNEEEYIDLVPILQNLCMEPEDFLKPIKKVEISYD